MGKILKRPRRPVFRNARWTQISRRGWRLNSGTIRLQSTGSKYHWYSSRPRRLASTIQLSRMTILVCRRLSQLSQPPLRRSGRPRLKQWWWSRPSRPTVLPGKFMKLFSFPVLAQVTLGDGLVKADSGQGHCIWVLDVSSLQHRRLEHRWWRQPEIGTAGLRSLDWLGLERAHQYRVRKRLLQLTILYEVWLRRASHRVRRWAQDLL